MAAATATTSTATTAMAALPAAGGARPRHLIATGTALVCAGATTAFGALFAAYAELRSHTSVWPPKGIKIDEYLANMLIITMLLGSLSVLWAVSAVKRDDRRQASAAFAITMGFGIAFLNLLSYSVSRQHVAMSANAYAGVVGAMTGLLGVVVAAAIGFAFLTLLRVRGEHVTAADPDVARAAMWFWHYATAATVFVWFAVLVLR
jgi:heme/copper-type cytochrome/quinol oxidase subunit 3